MGHPFIELRCVFFSCIFRVQDSKWFDATLFFSGLGIWEDWKLFASASHNSNLEEHVIWFSCFQGTFNLLLLIDRLFYSILWPFSKQLCFPYCWFLSRPQQKYSSIQGKASSDSYYFCTLLLEICLDLHSVIYFLTFLLISPHTVLCQCSVCSKRVSFIELTSS